MFKLDREGKELLVKELAKKISHYDVRRALENSIVLILKEDDIKDLLPKAIEKASKDIAKWKLARENVYYGVQLEKINSKVDSMIESFNKVMKEAQEYKDIMKHLKEQTELLKV